ncbi:hypothetical protein [Sporosalibacterium faouarense]|uniref:hypothetical protein n=1 Tax=Sporosalibacterium faouarense TaxID=516123 RepID=UPI00141CD392|nr:hypothetical protein [Sporosalibacterium faouarense]MTI46950.1 hypothetical protein [Bacillota bacterium]
MRNKDEVKTNPVDYLVHYKYKSTNYIIGVKFSNSLLGRDKGIYINDKKLETNSLDFTDNRDDNIIKVIV